MRTAISGTALKQHLYRINNDFLFEMDEADIQRVVKIVDAFNRGEFSLNKGVFWMLEYWELSYLFQYLDIKLMPEHDYEGINQPVHIGVTIKEVLQQLSKKVKYRFKKQLTEEDYYMLKVDLFYDKSNKGKNAPEYSISGGIRLWPYSYRNYKVEATIYCAVDGLVNVSLNN